MLKNFVFTLFLISIKSKTSIWTKNCKPVKTIKKIILSRSERSIFIEKRSKSLFFELCKLEEKIILLPLGKK